MFGLDVLVMALEIERDLAVTRGELAARHLRQERARSSSRGVLDRLLHVLRPARRAQQLAEHPDTEAAERRAA